VKFECFVTVVTVARAIALVGSRRRNSDTMNQVPCPRGARREQEADYEK
jgi:hypothetical protein